MDIRHSIRFSNNEIETLSKTVSLLDNIIKKMSMFKAKEVITEYDDTYDIDFIDTTANMLFELMDNCIFMQ